MEMLLGAGKERALPSTLCYKRTEDTSSEIEDLIETHLLKPRAILQSRVLGAACVPR